ncbi:MAG: tetratricopeptide repeat protein [bacterium]|nr:tetratricopeptide repeat protein [bacterium]
MASLCWNTQAAQDPRTTQVPQAAGAVQGQAAQDQADSLEALLNAYYDLWQQLERQPTSEEVDARSPYPAGRYLEEWDNWENVRLALAEYLYQQALVAALREDGETAAEYYRKCLEIDPDHPQASAAYGIDLDEAALKRDEFTQEKAGPAAQSSFLTFLALLERGDEQAARNNFLLAQSQKAAYIASEIAKLQAVYDNAVELFNQGTFGKAVDLFRILIEIRPNQIGYEEFYRPNAGSIRQYLADAIYRNETERSARFATRSKDARLAVWYTGNWMAQFGELGLEATRLAPTGASQARVPLPNLKMAARSYLGGDLGVSVRLTGFLWAGASWSQFMITPHAEFTLNNLDHTPRVSGAHISALSFFAETSTMVSRTTRMYLQAGAGRYSASFPSVLLGNIERPPRLMAHRSTSIGGFVGGGCDVWFFANDTGLLGVRLDLKYHRMSGDDLDSNRSITLSGLRLGAGITFSL